MLFDIFRSEEKNIMGFLLNLKNAARVIIKIININFYIFNF